MRVDAEEESKEEVTATQEEEVEKIIEQQNESGSDNEDGSDNSDGSDSEEGDEKKKSISLTGMTKEEKKAHK